MKIAIAVNHSYPNVGGSETVIKQVSEGLVKQYGYDCIVISTTTKASFEHKGVRYLPCPNSHLDLYNMIKDCDHLLVYSDLFIHWPRMIHDISKVPCPVTLAPVGLNGALRKSIIMGKLKSQHDKMRFICHTDGYHDYTILKDMGADVRLIPNAIDLNEFDNCKEVDVFDKYDIDKGKINILNVSNFYPDKGQQLISASLAGLEDKCNVTLISSGNRHGFNNQLRSMAKRTFETREIEYKMLEDISREDTINFFKQADLFVFPSLIESFGIVPMESMACRTPWVAYPVGNMKNFKGGELIDGGFSVGLDGKISPQEDSFRIFSLKISKIALDEELRVRLGEEGRRQIEEEYCLKAVLPKYKEAICG